MIAIVVQTEIRMVKINRDMATYKNNIFLGLRFYAICKDHSLKFIGLKLTKILDLDSFADLYSYFNYRSYHSTVHGKIF